MMLKDTFAQRGLLFFCRLFAALWVLILIGFMQVMTSCYSYHTYDNDGDDTRASVYDAVIVHSQCKT